jgi:hypothetical protein
MNEKDHFYLMAAAFNGNVNRAPLIIYLVEGKERSQH